MDFFTTLVQYETHLWNHLDQRLRARGEVELSTLAALHVVRRHEGTCRVQDLHTDLGITVGAASKLVDRLERDGLAARGANPVDRRSSLITLTDAGHEAHASGWTVLQDGLSEHLADEADVVPLTATLNRLRETLTKRATEVSR